MDTGGLKGLEKLKCRVCDAVRHLPTILAMLEDGSIARTNVRINQPSRKKSGFAHIAEIPFLSTLLCRVSVARWSAELLVQKLKHGPRVRGFYASVSSVVKSFGDHQARLKEQVVGFVPLSARLIPKKLTSHLRRVFTGPGSGIKQGTEFLQEMALSVANVDLLVKAFMSTIKNSSETAVRKVMIILSHSVQVATGWSIGKWSNSLRVNNLANQASLGVVPSGAFLFSTNLTLR
jgi:hypothetical protein